MSYSIQISAFMLIASWTKLVAISIISELSLSATCKQGAVIVTKIHVVILVVVDVCVEDQRR